MPNHEFENETERLEVFAKEYVNTLSPELITDLGGIARLVHVLHTGNNALGERISPDERRILSKTLQVQEQRIANKYTHGQVGELEYGYHLDIHTVRHELVRRTEKDSNSSSA